ncbi:MAG: NfeD family protein [Bacteroidales bacterium]
MNWEIIIFVIGLILLLSEVVLFPGLGVAALLGVACLGVALMGWLAETAGIDVGHIFSGNMDMEFMLIILGILVFLTVFFFLAYRIGKKGLMKRAALEREQSVEDGYIGVPTDLAKYIGQDAKSITDLRPSGKINIDGEILDAVSLAGFVSVGASLKVVKYENSQLYVIVAED